MPGGKLENNETYEETAVREVKEETGLHVFNLKKLYIDFDYDIEVHTYFTYDYNGELFTKENHILKKEDLIPIVIRVLATILMTLTNLLALCIQFCIQSLQSNPATKKHYYEPALLFMLGLVMLLASLYKITNYNRIDEIRVHRIEKQFMYNGSIYLNMFILVFYSLVVLKESKVPMIAYRKFYESITQK